MSLHIPSQLDYSAGWLKWHDVSTGQLVAEYGTKKGLCRAMRHNPYNAVIHLGHANGADCLSRIRLTILQ